MATVRELITRLGFNVDNSGLNKYEKTTERVKDKANDAAASFRNMFAAFAGIAAIRSISSIADSMQSLEARIGMLPQTVGSAGAAFETIAAHASKARQSIDAYGTLYVRLAGATKNFLTSQEEVLEVTDAISQAMVVGGANAIEAESAMLQLSQGFQKGKLDGDEFRSFMETMSTTIKEKLAKALGKDGVDALYEMSSSGQLTAKKLASAFKEIGPEIEEMMLKMPLNIGQAITIIGTKWGRGLQKINRETMIITNIAKFIVAAMGKIGAGVEKFIKSVGGAENALKLLTVVAGSFFAVWIAGWIASATATLVALAPVLLLAAKLALLALLFEDVYGWFMGYDSLLGDTIGGVEKWRTEVDNVTGAFRALMKVAGALWDNVLRPILGFSWFLFTKGLEWVNALFGAILSTVSAIVSAIKTVGNFIGNTDYAVAMQAPKVNYSAFGGMATGGGTQNNSQNVTVNVPPGTSAQTMEAARKGAMMGLNESPQFFSQIGQAL